MFSAWHICYSPLQRGKTDSYLQSSDIRLTPSMGSHKSLQ